MRKAISFHDNWTFSKPGETAAAVTLPHTWNNVDGQDGGNDYWRGTATYSKAFPKPELRDGERCFIEFLGAAMTADVILNGKLLAHHESGYSAFRTDLTDALEDENLLVVSVDNSANDRVYPQMADFTFYGGLYRDVNLIVVPEAHFELLKDGTPGIKVTSCGLNDGPLMGKGCYEARIACSLGAVGGMVKSDEARKKDKKKLLPTFTQSGEDREANGDQYIANLRNGSWCGFKYFAFDGSESKLTITARGSAAGTVKACINRNMPPAASVPVKPSDDWTSFSGELDIPSGEAPLTFVYDGSGSLDFASFEIQ